MKKIQVTKEQLEDLFKQECRLYADTLYARSILESIPLIDCISEACEKYTNTLIDNLIDFYILLGLNDFRNILLDACWYGYRVNDINDLNDKVLKEARNFRETAVRNDIKRLKEIAESGKYKLRYEIVTKENILKEEMLKEINKIKSNLFIDTEQKLYNLNEEDVVMLGKEYTLSTIVKAFRDNCLYYKYYSLDDRENIQLLCRDNPIFKLLNDIGADVQQYLFIPRNDLEQAINLILKTLPKDDEIIIRNYYGIGTKNIKNKKISDLVSYKANEISTKRIKTLKQLHKTISSDYSPIAYRFGHSDNMVRLMDNTIRDLNFIKDKPLEDLGFSTRAYNVLRRNGIHYLSDVAVIDKYRLRAMRNAGKVTRKEVVDIRNKYKGYKIIGTDNKIILCTEINLEEE